MPSFMGLVRLAKIYLSDDRDKLFLYLIQVKIVHVHIIYIQYSQFDIYIYIYQIDFLKCLFHISRELKTTLF